MGIESPLVDFLRSKGSVRCFFSTASFLRQFLAIQYSKKNIGAKNLSHGLWVAGGQTESSLEA